MTDVASITGGRIYLDTNVLIYFVEGNDSFSAVLRDVFQAIDNRSLVAVTSELTLAEVLVKPLAEAKTAIASIYRTLLSGEGPIRMLTVDRSVLLAAAELRARLGGRLFDAIHVASAAQAACDVFLTQDLRISAPSGVRKLRLSEMASAR